MTEVGTVVHNNQTKAQNVISYYIKERGLLLPVYSTWSWLMVVGVLGGGRCRKAPVDTGSTRDNDSDQGLP